MSRLIKVFVKPVLFRLANNPGPACIPILKDFPNNKLGTIGELPEGGAYCQFITAYQHLRDYQKDKFVVIGVIPGDSLVDCYQRWGMDQDSARPWIKILYKETIGWITLEHVEKIYEIDFDQNGNTIETLAYPYPSED